MRAITLYVALWALLSGSSQALAEVRGEATLAAMQPPVWLEQDGRMTPLRPGDSFGQGAELVTGPGARARLNLPDGGVVRLGERARFALDQLEMQSADEGLVTAATRVLRGAFRYTTGLLEREREREVTVEVGVYTAGIRGTDIWGRSREADGDLMALLDGEIEVFIAGQDAPLRPEPLTFLSRAPGTEAGRDPQPIDMDTLGEWAAETDLHPHQGVMEPAAPWTLVLMSVRDRSVAEATAEGLREAGYAVAVSGAQVHGRNWHRVILPDFVSSRDAAHIGEQLDGRLDVEGPWVKRD